MRIVQQLIVSKDVQAVSPLDLVSRAKFSIVEDFGEKLFQHYPEIIEVKGAPYGNTLVEMDIVVFTAKDFHKAVQEMSNNMGLEEFNKVVKALDLKEIK